MTLVIFLAALIGGMLIGLPICFALLFSGVCMMLYLNGFNAQILSQNLFSGADSFSMMAVPFFITMGCLMGSGGISEKLIALANACVGSECDYRTCPRRTGLCCNHGNSLICKYDRISCCFHCIPWSDPHSYDGTCRL